MNLALAVALCIEAIYLWDAVERLAPGVGWTTVACVLAVDWVLQIPTRPLTAEEREELYGRAPYLDDEEN